MAFSRERDTVANQLHVESGARFRLADHILAMPIRVGRAVSPASAG